jgi:hypothetical protein
MPTPLEQLRAVFPASKQEGLTDTAAVMNLPSGVTRELAAQAIDQIDLNRIFRDLGALVAREIADELDAMALRPADYVDLPDLPKLMAGKVSKALASVPETFVVALIEQLKLRG